MMLNNQVLHATRLKISRPAPLTFATGLQMTPYKIHGNEHGGIHAGKSIVKIEPAQAKIDIRHCDKITIRAESVVLDDGTKIDGPEIHAFMDGPGCT